MTYKEKINFDKFIKAFFDTTTMKCHFLSKFPFKISYFCMERHIIPPQGNLDTTVMRRLLQAFVEVTSNQIEMPNREIDQKLCHEPDPETTFNYNSMNVEQRLLVALKGIGIFINDSTANVTPNITPNVSPNITPNITPNVTPNITPNITPNKFITFLNNLIGQEVTPDIDLKTVIKDQSLIFCCPFSVIDSNINRRDMYIHYIKFVCKLHTKRFCCCKASFTVYIKDNKVSSIKFHERNHNHSLDELYIGSKVALLTSNKRREMRLAASRGLPTSFIRKFYGPDILPNQIYNIIKNQKKSESENEIQKLYEYVKSIKIDYDFIWQEDENNLFYSLLIVNARIRKCAYSNDIVMIDDTVCTNQFGYPFINFIVFDENNMVQNLAVAIITSKEENNFVNIFQNLKEIIPEIRVFVIDRLRSQINALQKVYPQAYLVYCRIHIYRNIKNKMGSNKEILNLFWNFVEMKITENEYINKLKKQSKKQILHI